MFIRGRCCTGAGGDADEQVATAPTQHDEDDDEVEGPPGRISHHCVCNECGLVMIDDENQVT